LTSNILKLVTSIATLCFSYSARFVKSDKVVITIVLDQSETKWLT